MRRIWVLIPFIVGCAKESAPRTPVDNRPGILDSIGTSEDSEVVQLYLARKERWAIKTGADGSARRVKIGQPKQTTVGDLTKLRRPAGMPLRGGEANQRLGPVEYQVYTVDAEIVRYKFETDDQDIHVVIRDPGVSKPTMIVEFADPSVVTKRSPFWKQIRDSRQAFFRRFKPTTRFKKTKVRARITGVGFFDFKHGQSGLAPNGIELHPVLDIRF